jgi:predicted transcriptional regulator
MKYEQQKILSLFVFMSRLFIASSVESLDIADAVNLNLDHEVEVTIWRNGTFELSSNTIDSLVNKANSMDFALFIFSPDDLAIIKGQHKKTVRDNVLFELGIFIGSIGKERCFILKPRCIDLHFPTDLLGLIIADYEPNRSDNDLASAVNHSCVLMKQRMQELKTREHSSAIFPSKKTSINVGELKQNDYLLLHEFIDTETTNFEGHSLDHVSQTLEDKNLKIDLSIIRLETLGYLEKINECDMNGKEYYVYKITNEGIQILFENEDTCFSNQSTPKNDSSNPMSLDSDDIPF